MESHGCIQIQTCKAVGCHIEKEAGKERGEREKGGKEMSVFLYSSAINVS